MTYRTALVAMACLYASTLFANPQVCQGEECYAKFTTVSLDNNLLKNSPKVAWWYGRESRPSRSDAGGSDWFISMPRKGPVNSNGTFVFEPGKSAFAAYDSNGDLVKSGRASGGMAYCDDIYRSCRTPVGTFRVHSKGDADCISRKYPVGEGGAPMPYCMYFNGGYAIHGSYYVPNHPASHGCIRLIPATAQWLHQNFIRVGTVVKVHPY